MGDLESQAEDTPKRILWYKLMSCLGQIRPHRRDETWSTSLWQTFFTTSVGAQIPLLAEIPFSSSGSRKFQIDSLGDHLFTCTVHSGVKRLTSGRLIKWLTSFTQPTKWKRNRWIGVGVSDVGTLNWLVTSRIRRVRCLWCWISSSLMTVLVVTLTLALMDTYIIPLPSHDVLFTTQI